jgi:hypothetical protein
MLLVKNRAIVETLSLSMVNDVTFGIAVIVEIIDDVVGRMLICDGNIIELRPGRQRDLGYRNDRKDDETGETG